MLTLFTYLFSLPSAFFSLLFYTLFEGIFIMLYVEVQLEEEDTWYKLTDDVQKIDKTKYRIFDKNFC